MWGMWSFSNYRKPSLGVRTEAPLQLLACCCLLFRQPVPQEDSKLCRNYQKLSSWTIGYQGGWPQPEEARTHRGF